MSRPYKITVKETLKQTVVAEDSISTTLDVPAILPPDRTAGIVARILREHGFDDDGDGNLTRERGGVVVEVNPDTRRVTASSSSSSEVEVTDKGGGGGCPCAVRTREKVLQSLQENLARETDQKRAGMQKDVTDRLEKAVSELGCELEQVSNQATATALREKAKQLGEIKSITHNNETGSMTIVVEV